VPISLKPEQQEMWRTRRARLFAQRLTAFNRRDLLDRFFKLTHLSERTADYLMSVDAATCLRVTEYLVEFPEEATRLCYLDPQAQEEALAHIAAN